jgi:hypothetical protein
MTSKQKFMAEALLVLAGACVAVQGQTSPSVNDPQTERSTPAGNAKKQDREQRKLAKSGKQAKPHPTKHHNMGKDEAPSSAPIEYGG